MGRRGDFTNLFDLQDDTSRRETIVALRTLLRTVRGELQDARARGDRDAIDRNREAVSDIKDMISEVTDRRAGRPRRGN